MKISETGTRRQLVGEVSRQYGAASRQTRDADSKYESGLSALTEAAAKKTHPPKMESPQPAMIKRYRREVH